MAHTKSGDPASCAHPDPFTSSFFLACRHGQLAFNDPPAEHPPYPYPLRLPGRRFSAPARGCRRWSFSLLPDCANARIWSAIRNHYRSTKCRNEHRTAIRSKSWPAVSRQRRTLGAKQLTIRGIGGRPVIRTDGRSAERKGIWVIRQGRFSIENIEFRDARPEQTQSARASAWNAEH